MRRNLLAAVLLFLPVIVSAQKLKGGGIYIRSSYMHLFGIDEILQTASPSGTENLADNFWSVGGEISLRRTHHIFALDGNIGGQAEKSTGCTRVQPFTGNLLFKYGRMVYERKKIWIYPSIEAGAAAGIVTSYDRIGKTAINQQVKYLLSPAAVLGLNMDWLPEDLAEDYKIVSGGVIGMRIAMTYYPFFGKWSSNNNLKYQTPSEGAAYKNIIGFSVSLVVGIVDYSTK